MQILAKARTVVDGEAADVQINVAESPLGWLMRRGMISRRQYDAGEQMRADFHIASLGPRVTMRWEAAGHNRVARGPHAGIDPSTAQIAAKARFEAAVKAAGPGLSDMLWRVVCSGDGLADAERAMGWPVRAGKVVLGLALDRVADHYGMA